MSGRKKEPPKFSQFDEDFILKDLIRGFTGRCADIGARERKGSNVARLIDDGWEAQLIDRNINGLLKDFPRAKFPLVTITQRSVTPENVNQTLWPDVDLLSIDIDGPDADVWEAIEQRPWIVVIEAVEVNRPKIVQVSEWRGYKLHAETGPNLIYVR